MHFNLFWRTFVLLGLLLLVSTLLWMQSFRALEDGPRAEQTAQQIASLVNLTRAALVHSDSIARMSLIKILDEEEGVRVLVREVKDRYEPYARNSLDRLMVRELADRLGDSATTVARSVNGEEGLWVSFKIEGDRYWLLTDYERLNPSGSGRTWLMWLLAASALSLIGSAWLAGLLNRPLQRLSEAAAHVREGRYDALKLEEDDRTSEIRAVNIGFNRMARQLAKAEQDRAIMLAGISHDLRTPLARLRLEAELSVPDASARDAMAADIDQLDTIIHKFMDYARPDSDNVARVPLIDVVEACAAPYQDAPDTRVSVSVPGDLVVLADAVELGRVLTNLLENARRYGKTPGTDGADIALTAERDGPHVRLRLRDHGAGVPPEQLPDLTRPFFRGDAARTHATGTGLGLAIVRRIVEHMGGELTIANAEPHGLQIDVLLPIAPAEKPKKEPAAVT